MSVRELVFDIGFQGDAGKLLQTDKAVSNLKNNLGKTGSALDEVSKKGSKAFDNVGKSVNEASKETLSFTKDMKDMVAKSKVGQSLSEVGKSVKSNLGETMSRATKTAKDKLQEIGAAVKSSLGRAFPETSRHGQIAIGVMNDLGRAGKASFTAITTYAGKANEANQRFSQSLQSLSTKMAGISATSGKIGNSLMTKVTLPLSIAGGKMLKTGMDFEEGMSEVKALSGASAAEMEQLTKKAREMGAKTKFSAVQSAQALKYMGMAGWDTDKMLAGLPGVMNLAAASGEDLGTVSDIVTDSMTAFGLSADQSGHFADVLAQASSKSNTSVGLMGETFKYAAPVAGALGYSIEDTAVAIGLMANKGIKGSQAGTALRSTLSNLAKPTGQMKSAMSELGISLTDSQGQMKPFSTVLGDMRKGFSTLTEAQKAQYASTIFGQEAMSGMLAIIDTSEEDYNKLANAIGNADGAAQKMADERLDNLKGQLTKLGSGLSELGLQVYDLLAPKIKKGVEAFQGLVDKFSKLDDKTKMTAIKIAGLALAAGPLFKVFQFASGGIGLFAKGLSLVAKHNVFDLFTKIGTGIGKFKAGFMAIKAMGFKAFFASIGSSILPLIVTIGLVVVAGYLLYKNWDTVKAKGLEFVGTLKTQFAGFVQTVQGLWENIKTIFIGLLPVFGGVIGGILGGLGSFIKTTIGIVDSLITVFKGITDFLIGVFTGDWGRAWNGIKDIFTGVIDGIKGIFSGVMDFFSGVINGFLGGVETGKTTAENAKAGSAAKKSSVKSGKGRPLSRKKPPHFAKGVDNFGGGLAVVGERGPELLNLPSGSSVTSNAKTERLFDSGLSELSKDAWKAPIAGNSSKVSYIFSPKIEVTTSSDKPEEIAETTKNKIKEYFDEWIDDADLAG